MTDLLDDAMDIARKLKFLALEDVLLAAVATDSQDVIDFCRQTVYPMYDTEGNTTVNSSLKKRFGK